LLDAPDACQPIHGYVVVHTVLGKHQPRPTLEVRTERGAIHLAGICYGRLACVQSRNLPTKPNKFAFEILQRGVTVLQTAERLQGHSQPALVPLLSLLQVELQEATLKWDHPAS
tara:strand:+ start:194 stop:535 length:342 start_codon:yes stop_codon:yes gene_type:complete